MSIDEISSKCGCYNMQSVLDIVQGRAKASCFDAYVDKFNWGLMSIESLACVLEQEFYKIPKSKDFEYMSLPFLK